MPFLSNLRRRASLVLRFFLTPTSTNVYIAKIRKSGRFDRDFYRSTAPQLNRVYRYFPERHYVRYGEQAGLRPNPEFAPTDYLALNNDLAKSNVRPFEHYIDIGHTEDRPTQKVDFLETNTSIKPPVLRLPPDFSPARVAISLHIYYPELWAEFESTLATLDFDFDLFISATHRGEETDRLFAKIRRTFPQTVCFAMPNLGRDIFPFVHLVNSGLLSSYEAVCKLHTKKSPHRVDGEKWRKHLVKGLLNGSTTWPRLERFLDDESAAIWVADGQNYKGVTWWGSNLDNARRLLRRVEILPKPEALSFPAGSMYWLKSEMISMIKGLQLKQSDFEPEQGQVDGTLAHAFERSIGYFPTSGGQEIYETSQLSSTAPLQPLPRPKYTSAFYLPQFHPTPENDKWWGHGFTEWTSTVKATPLFEGHNQPVLPADMGFYDLRLPQVMEDQAKLAKAAGIDAFCVYHYWFDGQRLLEAPLDNLLKATDKEFPFYLCWANESWRRNWDGLSGEVLMEQTYKQGFETQLAQSVLPYMRDPRYVRPNGQTPRFVIYRPEDMPEPELNIQRMREAWRQLGVGDVEIGAVRFHQKGAGQIDENAVDFWIEMPPHGLVTGDDVLYSKGGPNRLGVPLPQEFEGLVYSYANLADKRAKTLPRNTIAGIMPSWDNTARRGTAAHIAYECNPQSFSRWLNNIREHKINKSYRGELFINAWNEWAENAALEPNHKYGDAYLKVLQKHLCSQRRRMQTPTRIAAE